MDSLSSAYHWISYAAAWIATVALLLLARRPRHPKNLNPPPGPKPWPIIGNLNLLGSLPHRSIHDLSQKYGEIMQLKIGSYNVVVGSSVEMAKVFLKTMDVNFACRPKTATGKYTNYNYSGITWSPYGPYWSQARKICLMELFSVKRLESHEYIRVEETNSLLKTIFETAGEEIPLKDLLARVSLNVICRMVLGKRYLDKSEESNTVVSPDEFVKMVDEWILLNGVFNIGDFMPWIDFMDLQGYTKRMKTLNKKFDRFLENVLDEHNERRREAGENFEAKDMVDVLLQLSDDPNLDVKLERHGVKAVTLDLLTGGTGRAARTVKWAFFELLKNPQIFQTANEELDRVIGKNRWVEEKDMSNLPYIKAIVKETMRLHPVVPLLTPRRARENCQVAGYDITEGTRVLVSVWTIGRDPKLWDKPEEFYPERFIGKEIDIKGHDFELLPFGAGRRMCVGYSLGLKVVESTLANLIHGFNWKLPNIMTKNDLNMEEIFGLTIPKKNSFFTVAYPRLPIEMYRF